MNLRNLLHEYKWNSKFIQTQKDLVIIFIHRGAPNDEKSINFSNIIKIQKKFIILREMDKLGDYTNIPIHRIKNIINKKTRKIIYQKKLIKIEPQN
jgi:uncharacterized protein (UPF0248 family)